MSPDIRRGRSRNGVVALNYHMAQLASKAVVAVNQLTVTTNAGASVGTDVVDL